MEVQWMNHTGFVVSDMERALAFYRDLLGLNIERDQILEGEFISELVGLSRRAAAHRVPGAGGYAPLGGVDPVSEPAGSGS